VEVVGRAWFELGNQVQTEVTGLNGLGVHEETPTPDIFGQLHQSNKDVLKQSCAEPSSFVVDLHAKAGQEGHRLGITAGALAKPLRCVRQLNLGHTPGVVGDDLGAALLGDYEYPGGAGCGCLAGIAAKPLGLLG
jgi:hypothetical protein